MMSLSSALANEAWKKAERRETFEKFFRNGIAWNGNHCSTSLESTEWHEMTLTRGDEGTN